jgi:hypothetical protein
VPSAGGNLGLHEANEAMFVGTTAPAGAAPAIIH